jgi:SAM-dependent methyltransferase
MRYSDCYVCKKNSTNFYIKENGWTLVKCTSCGLLYVNPRPDDSDISQSSKTGQHKGKNLLNVTGNFSQAKLENYQKVLTDIFGESLPKDINSWLDIGCGYGEFLLAIQNFEKREILLRGLEPNEEKSKLASQRNLDVSNFELDKHDCKYDVISLLNVYSHLPDPPQNILELRSLLNPCGMILLQTGDTANFSSSEQLRPFYLPDHLSFANQKIVVDILERNGFEIITIKKYPSIQFSIGRFFKELIKVFIPDKYSNLKALINYSKFVEADMYILAKLTF